MLDRDSLIDEVVAERKETRREALLNVTRQALEAIDRAAELTAVADEAIAAEFVVKYDPSRLSSVVEFRTATRGNVVVPVRDKNQ